MNYRGEANGLIRAATEARKRAEHLRAEAVAMSEHQRYFYSAMFDDFANWCEERADLLAADVTSPPVTLKFVTKSATEAKAPHDDSLV